MEVKSIICARSQEGDMKSNTAKVLHKILGRPLINYPVEAVKQLGIKEICVKIGKPSDNIMESIDKDLVCVTEDESGIKETIDFIGNARHIIVINGDTPLITRATLEEMLTSHEKAGNSVTRLFTSVCVLKAQAFKLALLKILDNKIDHYAMKDIVEILIKEGHKVDTITTNNTTDLIRVNSRSQLAQCARIIKERINEGHMENGVTLEDPRNTYIEPDVTIGFDTIIEPNCMLKGKTTIGSNCLIGCHSNIVDTQIANGVHIENSVIYGSSIDENSYIGPFAYIRPESKIGKDVRIGDFVEIKNSSIDNHTKISHLTYVGDADVGKYVNFGCGSVLVNYDGVNKHRSTIEDHAFVGCNTNLVSPVTIGKGAYTAAGSTITKDVPEESLGISRVRQVNKEGWVTYKNQKT